MSAKKPKDPLRKAKLDLIGRLVDIPESKLVQRTFWPREVKLANELYTKYSEDFWSKVTLDYKLKSLAFLKCPRGQEDIEKKWREFNYVPPVVQVVDYQHDKVGEDREIRKMPNLFDFLRKKP